MTTCLKRAGALLSCAMVMLAANSALAGTVRPSSHPGCDYEFRELIAQGVAAGLESIGGSYDGVTLCLDSPGGSLPEGMAMFEAIRDMNIITRVPAGWRCESSCALAFMAGSITTGMGVPVTIGAHQLDPGGMLGFHAPALQLDSARTYSHGEVARGFEVALGAAATLYRASLQEADEWRSFNEYLYARLLETPYDAMYRIETVADAIMSGVTLGSVRLPERITQRAVAHLCDAAFLMEQGALLSRVPSGPALMAWRQLRGADLPANRREWVQEVRSIELQRQGSDLVGRIGGYARTRHHAIGCQVTIGETAANRATTAFSPFDPAQGVSVGFYRYELHDLGARGSDGASPLVAGWRPEGEHVYQVAEALVPLWYLHDPATPLASLAPGAGARRNGGQDATHRISTFEGGFVNLRAGPGTSHRVIRELPHGTALRIEAQGADGWVRIRTSDGAAGWVSGRLLARQ